MRNYELTNIAIEELTKALLVSHPPVSQENGFACYRIADRSQFSSLGRSLECAVFNEVFKNTPAELLLAYQKYERYSDFLVVVDTYKQVAAGVIRIIKFSRTAGFKSLNDLYAEPLRLAAATVIREHKIDAEKCWDVGTLAVLREYRNEKSNHFVSSTLYSRLYSEMLDEGIKHAVAILDKFAYADLTGFLGIPFKPVCNTPEFSYMGSKESRAVCAAVSETEASVRAVFDNLTHEQQKLLGRFFEAFLNGTGVPEVTRVL